MSNLVFPALPGLQREVDRGTMYRTTIHETAGGKEQRTSWGSSPRYRYVLPHRLRSSVPAPAPWQAYSELSIVQYFFDAHYGAYDSFLVSDPQTGSQVRVRFGSDEYRVRRIVGALWACDLDLVTVL